MVNKRVQNAVLGCNLKTDRMISVRFQGKPFNIIVSQAYVPTSNIEEAEVERSYEDLQDLLELTPKKDVLFIIGDWNAKVGSQETPGVTGEFGLGIQNEAGQRLIEFCQENALVIANTLFQQHKRRLYTWTSPCVNTEIRSRDCSTLGFLVLHRFLESAQTQVPVSVPLARNRVFAHTLKLQQGHTYLG